MLKVGLRATPSTGSTATAFTVQWATGAPPDGIVFDVQIKRPGTTAWKPFRTDTTAGSVVFVPDKGAGSYSFRAQTQRAGGASTGWSIAKTISVS